MARQSIDTAQVTFVINKIRTIEKNINNAFNSLQGKMGTLNSWKGPTGAAAQTLMHELFKNNAARSDVMKNYAELLERLVNPAYEAVENQNRSLANLFK